MFKKLNMFALTLLILGQTILGPIGITSVAFAEDSEEVAAAQTEAQEPQETQEIVQETVKKDTLKTLLDNKRDAAEYEEDSYAAYVQALAAGQNVYNNNEATQEAVDTVVNTIQQAVTALIVKEKVINEDPTDESGKPQGDDPDDGETDGTPDGTDEGSESGDDEEGENKPSVVNLTYPDMKLTDPLVKLNTVFKVNGEKVESNKVSVKNGDTANFDFTLEDILGDHEYGPGTKLEVEIPAIFKDVKAVGGQIGDIGTYSVVPGGNKVIVEFNKNIRTWDQDGNDIGSSAIENVVFYISATFEYDGSDLNPSVDIPGGDTIVLNFTPENGTPVKKEQGVAKDSNGDSVTKNPDYFEWTVFVNTDLKASDGKFRDVLGDGHTFKSGDKVIYTPLTMKADGDYDKGTPLEYVLPAGVSNEFTLNLDTDKAYKITYKTYPDDPGNGGWKQYNNTAYFDDKPSQNGTSSTFDTGIKKTVGSASTTDLTTDWEITVNENKRNLGQITVKDEWRTTGVTGAKQELVEVDGAKVNVYDGNGTRVTTGFTFNQTSNEQGFNIVFDNIGTETYVIKYKTKPTDDTYINDSMTVRNDVTRLDDPDVFKDSKPVTYPKTLFMLNKEAVSVDYAEKTMKWKITANQAGYTLPVGTVFEDRFTPNDNQTLKDGLTVKTLAGDEVSHTVNSLNKEGFNLILNEVVTGTIVIEYETDYDIKDTGSNERTYRNDVTITKDTSGLPADVTDDASQEIRGEQGKNGKKDGKYNYGTKRFEWEVELNFNLNSFTNAIFEDEIKPDTPGQTIDLSTVKVYEGTLNADGDFQQGSNITNNDKITVNGNTLKVDLGPISTPHKITYESYVTEDVIPEQGENKTLEVTNTATLTDNGTPNSSWEKDVWVNYTDKLIKKSMDQIGFTAGVKWNFEFNYAQSDLKDIIITDIVGEDADGNPNQLIKEDSFKVYKVNLSGKSADKNGGTATVETEEFTGYDLEVNAEEGTFTLELPDGDSAYYIEYETIFLGASGETLKNEVNVSYYTSKEEKAKGEYKKENFEFGGGGSTTKVPFVIVKTDATTGELLDGVEFELYRNGITNPILTGKTKEGILDFGIMLGEGNYTLVEKEYGGYNLVDIPPFTLDREKIAKSGTYKGYQVIEVENFPADIDNDAICQYFTLTVNDANGDARENVKVKYVNTTTGKEVDVTNETNNEGKVTVPRTDLPAGTYKVIEIDSNGDEIGSLGEVEVKYVGENCGDSVQPNTCPNFTITVNDENGDPRQNIDVTVKERNSPTVVAEGKTNADGQIVIDRENLPNAGTYDVFEGGIYLGEVKVDYNDGCEAEVTTENLEGIGSCPTFTLTVNDRSDNPREGVTVVVKDSDNKLIEDANGDPIPGLTTGADGKVTIDNVIKPGTYTVYEIDDNGKEKVINSFEVTTDCAAEVKPKSSGGGGGIPPAACENFIVTVKDSDGTPRANVTVTLKNADGNEYTQTTDANGKISLPYATTISGDYTVYEGTTVLGTITVNYADGDCKDEVTVPKTCDIFTITVKESGKTVGKDVEITLKDKDGKTVTTGKTDEKGKITFEETDLPEGTYKVYDKDGKEVGTVDVSYDKGACEDEVNLPVEACDIFTITVKESGKTVGKDVEITLKDKDGKTVTTGKTDANGKITFEETDLPKGTYTVYDEDGVNVGSVTVTYDGKCEAEVNVDPAIDACENFTLTVVDTPNATVEIKDKNGNTIASGTTDSTGKVTFNHPIAEGNYEVYINGKKESDLRVDESCEAIITPEKPVDPEKPTDPDKPGTGEPGKPGEPTDPGGDSNAPGGGKPGTGGDSNAPGGGKPGTGGDSNAPGGGKPGTGGDSNAPGGDKPGTGKLPQTGEEQFMYMIALGTLLLGAGAFVLYRLRKVQ